MSPQFPPPCVMGDESIMVCARFRNEILTSIFVQSHVVSLTHFSCLLRHLPLSSLSRAASHPRHTGHRMYRCKKIYVGIVIGKLLIVSVTTSMLYIFVHGSTTVFLLAVYESIVSNSIFKILQSSLCGTFWIL